MKTAGASTDEKGLVSFLKTSSAYSHQPRHVDCIETHISWVFIASPFVFKVKRPVNFGFADFSTLEKRHYFCQREFQLNRRLCPDMYLDVLPIYKNGRSYSFSPSGGIIEYALKMRELPRGFFLNELLARDAVGEKEIMGVIARLHEFYKAETPGAEIEEWGRLEKLRISTDENFAQVTPFIGTTLSPLALESIRHFTNSFYTANERLFAERIQKRRILDCHGDLRLDHVHITDKAVSIFDCIEFNDRFRFIDIANDLAFLAMDLDFGGRRDLAGLFLRTAARDFRDHGILKLAIFYKSYRAVVRGKVESMQAISQDVTNAEEHAGRAALYFRLALRYAVAGSKSLLLAVMGRVGTGKSTIARRLASELDWPLLSSDEVRKRLADVPLTRRTPAPMRGDVYSENMTARTYEKLVQGGIAGAFTYGGSVIDATFSTHNQRALLRAECLKAGIHFQIIELEASEEQVIERVKQRERNATEISDARVDDIAKLNTRYEPPLEVSELITVSASGGVYETAMAVTRRLIDKQLQYRGYFVVDSMTETA